MDPETVAEVKKSPSLSPSSSSSSSSTSESSSEDYFEVGSAKLGESAVSSNPSPEVDRDGQLVSQLCAEKEDLSISASADEQHNEVLEHKSLPLPIPVDTSEQKLQNLNHVSSRQPSPVGGECGNHGECEDVSRPMTLPLPPPASASTSELPQSPPDKDLGISDPKTDNCGKHTPSASALPPTSPVSATEPSRNNVTVTESPPVQTMERRGGEADPYRIPASIFATTNPKASMEWSMQSNESLFSIHMASMSYTKEQISFFSKSGELGFSGDPTTPRPASNFSSSSHHPASKKEEANPKMGDLGEDLSVTEAAAETMKEVMMANASQQGQEKDPPTLWAPNSCSISLRSEESIGSHRSFAFPILTKGEGLPGGSVRKASHSQRSQPQTSQQPASPQPPQPQASTAAQRPWFSCFPCCPYCS